ncbi:MAG: hypothetical protein RIQ89_1182, partial [Bacteroidota bacterium]
MRNKIVIVVLLLLATISTEAQNVLDGAYVKDHTATREPLPYPYLREADVMWSKRIWRVIDLKEKINLPFYYPLTGTLKDRKSLIDVILDACEEGSLTAYTTEEFLTPLTSEEFKKIGGAGIDSMKMMRSDPPYDEYDTVIVRTFSRDKVIAYRLKEEWFFDRQRSVLDCRIIGISPMMYAVDENGNLRPDNIKVSLFWIYYPEARKLFANAETFNRQNDAERRSFDDIFQKRMFSSTIYK